MKKLPLLICILLLCAGVLTACGRTPAVEAPAPPVPTATPAPDYTGQVVISEVMRKNTTCNVAPDGNRYAWLELENLSSATIDLTGWILSVNGEDTAIGERLILAGKSRCLL